MGSVCVIDFVGEGKKQGSGFANNPFIIKDQHANLSSKGNKVVSNVRSKSRDLQPGEIPESEWPKDYVKMSQKTESSTKNGVKTTKVTYVFTMADGEEITKTNEVKQKG